MKYDVYLNGFGTEEPLAVATSLAAAAQIVTSLAKTVRSTWDPFFRLHGHAEAKEFHAETMIGAIDWQWDYMTTLLRRCQAELIPLALTYGVDQTIPHLSAAQLALLHDYGDLLDEYSAPSRQLAFTDLRRDAGLLPSDAGILEYLVAQVQFRQRPLAEIVDLLHGDAGRIAFPKEEE